MGPKTDPLGDLWALVPTFPLLAFYYHLAGRSSGVVGHSACAFAQPTPKVTISILRSPGLVIQTYYIRISATSLSASFNIQPFMVGTSCSLVYYPSMHFVSLCPNNNFNGLHSPFPTPFVVLLKWILHLPLRTCSPLFSASAHSFVWQALSFDTP
jgi:hypothetical protein